MVGTIVPIVHGEQLRGGRPVSLWLYLAGSASGAAALGCFLAWAGRTLVSAVVVDNGAVVFGVLAGLHLVGAAQDLSLCRIPMPISRWQVPRRWVYTLSHRMASFFYGLVLGLAVATRIPHSMVPLLGLWVFLLGDVIVGGVIGASFGLGRTAPLIVIWLSRRPVLDCSRAIECHHVCADLLSGVVLCGLGGWAAAGTTSALGG